MDLEEHPAVAGGEREDLRSAQEPVSPTAPAPKSCVAPVEHEAVGEQGGVGGGRAKLAERALDLPEQRRPLASLRTLVLVEARDCLRHVEVLDCEGHAPRAEPERLDAADHLLERGTELSLLHQEERAVGEEAAQPPAPDRRLLEQAAELVEVVPSLSASTEHRQERAGVAAVGVALR